MFLRKENAYLNAMTEQMLEELYHKYGLNYIALCYSNAEGAYESGGIGEDHSPKVQLIPQVPLHLLHRTPLTVDIDYDMPDGTYIREYLHAVDTDTARAHVLALKSSLLGKKKQAVYTLGTGYGISVQDVIQTVEKITGRSASVGFSLLPDAYTLQILRFSFFM